MSAVRLGAVDKWMWMGLMLLLAPWLLGVKSAHGELRPIQLLARVGHVKKGTEKQTCFPVTFPSNHEVDVGRMVMRVHGGSHHVHLYRPVSGPVVYPTPDCPFAVDFSKWELVTATQNASLNWKLHPGVAIAFGPHQPLLIQTHFVNTGLLETNGRAHAKIVLHPMDPAKVTAHAGALFGQDRTVLVPPGLSTRSSTCQLTGSPAEHREMTVMALTGHYHFRGVRFEVWRTGADGTRGELVYQHDGYADPKFQQYQPGELVLQPGEGLEWACTWQNNTPETYEFGPNTQKNEHCNLFGYYYPTDDPFEAIDCVHTKDGQNVRIQAH